MKSLLKNWKVRILLITLTLALGLIVFKGLSMGIDFKGGTMFQIHLAEKATSEQMQDVLAVVSNRIDGFGLKGATATSWGNEFVIATLAETDPAIINETQALLSKQGRLETVLNSEIVFTGADITNIQETSTAYGVKPSQSGAAWVVPLVLSPTAARAFSEAASNQFVGEH